MNGSWKRVMPDIDDRLRILENKNGINPGLSEEETRELRNLTTQSYTQMPFSKEQKLRIRYLQVKKASLDQADLADKLNQEKEEAVRLGLVLRVPEINDRLQALEKVANSSNLPALEARLDKIEALVKTIQEKLEKIEVVKEEKKEVYHADEESIQYVYFLTLPILVLLLATILQKFLPKTYNEINPNMLLL